MPMPMISARAVLRKSSNAKVSTLDRPIDAIVDHAERGGKSGIGPARHDQPGDDQEREERCGEQRESGAGRQDRELESRSNGNGRKRAFHEGEGCPAPDAHGWQAAPVQCQSR